MFPLPLVKRAAVVSPGVRAPVAVAVTIYQIVSRYGIRSDCPSLDAGFATSVRIILDDVALCVCLSHCPCRSFVHMVDHGWMRVYPAVWPWLSTWCQLLGGWGQHLAP